MDVYKSEDEQVETLKRIVKSYGPPVIIGVILALVIGYGWRYWNHHKMQKAQNSSNLYQAMLNATSTKNTKDAIKFADQLQTDYASTPYAKLAALMEANFALKKQDTKTAEKKLAWVMKNADSTSVAQIATLRLARLDLQENHPQKALDLLKNPKDKSYTGLIENTKGDAYQALNQKQKANAAYKAAAKALPNNLLIQLKSKNAGIV